MKSRSGLAPLIVIAIVAALVIAGGIYFVAHKNQVASEQARSVVNDALPNDATKNYPSNWKTYTNKQYGFEVKYPSDWKPVACGSSDGKQVEVNGTYECTIVNDLPSAMGATLPGPITTTNLRGQDTGGMYVKILPKYGWDGFLRSVPISGRSTSVKISSYDFVQWNDGNSFATSIAGGAGHIEFYFEKPTTPQNILSTFKFTK